MSSHPSPPITDFVVVTAPIRIGKIIGRKRIGKRTSRARVCIAIVEKIVPTIAKPKVPNKVIIANQISINEKL